MKTRSVQHADNGKVRQKALAAQRKNCYIENRDDRRFTGISFGAVKNLIAHGTVPCVKGNSAIWTHTLSKIVVEWDGGF